MKSQAIIQDAAQDAARYTVEDFERVIPNYRELPNLLSPEQSRDITGIELPTLAKDRATLRRWEYIKFGSRIVKYSKVMWGTYMLDNLRGAK